MSIFSIQRPTSGQRGRLSDLSERHEEFIGLLCLRAGELGAETMVGLGPFVSLCTEAVSNVGHAWVGSPSLSRGAVSLQLNKGHQIQG